ncbi:MAG TPA: hypoxanthine phosphoribosyltransferase [Phycisphaerae bacterium]|nr:hypoxanthine phosphoribosyltransferase [Phycisphaerae bacterium]
MPHTDVKSILLDRKTIDRRVRELARQIARAYRGKEILLVPVLTGSMIFTADLIRYMPMKMRVDMVTVSSYPGRATRSKGAKILFPGALNVAGRHVLVVDDVLETGRSLTAIRKLLLRKRAASVRTCVLLRKHCAREKKLVADFIGFEIPNHFVVGYGMDYNHYYRNLPDVAVLKPRVFGKSF